MHLQFDSYLSDNFYTEGRNACQQISIEFEYIEDSKKYNQMTHATVEYCEQIGNSHLIAISQWLENVGAHKTGIAFELGSHRYLAYIYSYCGQRVVALCVRKSILDLSLESECGQRQMLLDELNTAISGTEARRQSPYLNGTNAPKGGGIYDMSGVS